MTKLFNKELRTGKKNNFSKLVRHFSGSSKRSGEWLEWFNDDMVEIVKREIGDYLIEFGYEEDNNWSVPSVDSGEKAAFRQKQDFTFDLFRKSDIFSLLDNDFSGKKVALYCAGVYAEKFINKLKNKGIVQFIIDDNSSEFGRKFCGIDVVHSSSAVSRYMDYDIILLFMHTQYHEKVMQNLREMGIPDYIVINAYDRSVDL